MGGRQICFKVIASAKNRLLVGALISKKGNQKISYVIQGLYRSQSYNVYYTIPCSHFLKIKATAKGFNICLGSPFDYVHRMLAHFENRENLTDRSPIHAKTELLLPADFESSRLWKRNSNQHILKNAIILTLENDENGIFFQAFK